MYTKVKPFKTILFGFAFSPSLKVNVLEATRIAYFFGAKLILLHVGEKTIEKSNGIETLLTETEHPELSVEIQWKNGNPFQVILETCKTSNIDLLILGAVQHENLFRFYVGSIARKLTRKVCCSVLLLIKPSAVRIPCKHIVVNGVDAPDTPLAIEMAFYVAKILGSQQLTIVEEILQKELHVTVEDDRSLKKANIMKERLKHREESRVRKIISELPEVMTKDVVIKMQSIFGKHGYSIGHYAEVVRADLLVMNAPIKTGLLDRIFTHDIEYILSDLPTDLLIVRN
ncbi:universal stress protein [Kriegella aquimaris]|uniref:Nucleotide-binding universal stress protein, UspA family n=1 Tax=Kriegella aquimaris TaxID=192904 RepID=A0A1G9YAG5_9FLAO|nr:universal stress protein [Kriegella aquimaris]SDN05505.1 Nucleotide-binding universal stress protein, UspA family [Kriegella aquimaris]